MTTVQAPKKYKFTKSFYKDKEAIIIPAPSSCERLNNDYYTSTDDGLIRTVYPNRTKGADGVERLSGFENKEYSLFTNRPVKTQEINVNPLFGEATDDQVYVRIGNKNVQTAWSGLNGKNAPVTDTNPVIINTSNVDDASTKYLLDKNYVITEAATASNEEYKYYNSNGVSVSTTQLYTLANGKGQIINVSKTKVIYAVPNGDELNVYNAAGESDLLFQVKCDSDKKIVYYDTFHLSAREEVLALFNKYLQFSYNSTNWTVTLYHDDDYKVFGTDLGVDNIKHVLTFDKPYSPSTKISKGNVSVSLAQNAQPECIVSFNSNGGSKIATVIKDAGNDILLPTPTRTGYTFKGWSTESGDSSVTRYTGNYHVTSSVTFNAIWEATEYTIKYYNDGTMLTTATNIPTKYTVENNVIFENWYDVEGYNADGWKLGSTNGEIITSTEGHTGNLKVYLSKTLIECTVIYNVNCPKDYIGNDETVNENVVDQTFDIKNPINELPELSTASGHYELAGWMLNGNKVTGITYSAVKDSLTNSNRITLVADWKPHEYTITFNNTQNPTKNETVKCAYGQFYNGVKPQPEKCEKDGFSYEFNYWSTSTDGLKFEFDEVRIISDIELYTVWTKTPLTETVTINYRVQNADGTVNGNSVIAVNNVNVGTDYNALENGTLKERVTLDKYDEPQNHTVFVTRGGTNTINLTFYRKRYELSINYNSTTDDYKNNFIWGANISEPLKNYGENEHHTFNGYIIEGSSNKIEKTELEGYQMPNNNLILTAIWTDNT